MEVALICTVFGVFILCSFKLGYQFGQNKSVEVVVPKEKKTIKEHIKQKKAEKEKEEELDEIYKIINNMENYNGTSEGQEVIK